MESFENLTSHLYDVISALYTVHKELGPVLMNIVIKKPSQWS
jgi:hypothetical protein